MSNLNYEHDKALKDLAYRGDFYLLNMVLGLPFTVYGIILACGVENYREIAAPVLLLFFGILMTAPCVKILCNPKVPIKYGKEGIYLYYMRRKSVRFIPYEDICGLDWTAILYRVRYIGFVIIRTQKGKTKSLLVSYPVKAIEKIEELKNNPELR